MIFNNKFFHFILFYFIYFTLYLIRYDKSIKDVIYVPSSQDRNEKLIIHKQQQDSNEIVLSPFSLDKLCPKNNQNNNTPKISLIEEISSSVNSSSVSGENEKMNDLSYIDNHRLNKTTTNTTASKVTIKNTCRKIKDSQNFQTSFETSHPIFKAPDIVSYLAASHNNQNHYIAIYSIYMKSIQIFKIELIGSSGISSKDKDLICIKKIDLQHNQTCKGLKLLFHKESLTLLILYAKELENDMLNNKIPVIKFNTVLLYNR